MERFDYVLLWKDGDDFPREFVEEIVDLLSVSAVDV